MLKAKAFSECFYQTRKWRIFEHSERVKKKRY